MFCQIRLIFRCYGKFFSPSFPLLFIPNSLNNFRIVRGSDLLSSFFDWYVFFFAMFIRFVTLLHNSIYAVILPFILHLLVLFFHAIKYFWRPPVWLIFFLYPMTFYRSMLIIIKIMTSKQIQYHRHDQILLIFPKGHYSYQKENKLLRSF